MKVQIELSDYTEPIIDGIIDDIRVQYKRTGMDEATMEDLLAALKKKITKLTENVAENVVKNSYYSSPWTITTTNGSTGLARTDDNKDLTVLYDSVSTKRV